LKILIQLEEGEEGEEYCFLELGNAVFGSQKEITQKRKNALIIHMIRNFISGAEAADVAVGCQSSSFLSILVSSTSKTRTEFPGIFGGAPEAP